MNAVLNPAGCHADGCGRPRHARGLCTMHYQRWKKSGQTNLLTTEERFFAKVERSEGGCWLWTGYVNPGGYGQFGSDRRRVVLAHRWSWERVHGRVPDETPHLDHLCRVTRCVNPDHLEAVTQAENNRRARPFRTYPAPPSMCRRGHQMDLANSYPRADRPGKFVCRKCQSLSQKAYMLRQRGRLADV